MSTATTPWHNPSPCLAETGIDAAALAALAGDRLLLFSLPPCSITVPAKDGLRDYDNVSFRCGAMVVPAAAAAIRATLTDFPRYVDLIPNTTGATVLAQDGATTRAEYEHTFALSMMTIRTRIVLAHTREPDGSLSAYLVDGDADAAVSRWEFLPLDDQRTLVFYSNWADIASGNLVLQMLLRAQPDLALAAPFGSAFVALEAVRLAFCPPAPCLPGAQCPVAAQVPAFPRADTHPLLATLAAPGPLVFIDNGQWLRDEGEIFLQRFIASACRVDGNVATVFQRATQFERFPEFLPLVRSATRRKRGDTFSIDWQVGMGLGFFSLGMRYRLAYTQSGDTALQFTREGGDFRRIDGRWDWQAAGDGQCLGSMTIGYRIGEDAPLVLRVARHLPHHDVLGGLYMGLSSMQRLRDWLAADAGATP